MRWLAVTTPALYVDNMFSDYCYIINTKEQADELFAIQNGDGLSPSDKDMRHEGATYIANHHNWSHRIQQILATLHETEC